MKALDFLNRLTMGRSILLGMVIAAFYYFFVFDPGVEQQNAIAASTTQIATHQETLLDQQRKLDSAAIYKKTAAEVGSTIQKLLSLIPEQFGMPDLMRIVSEETKAAGSSLENLAPQKTKISDVSPEFEEVSVTVDLNGSFLQHMVFLSNLTKINQILVVRKYTMNYVRDGKGDEAPVVGLKAEIVAFRYRGPATGAAPTDPAQTPQGTTQ